MKTPETKADFFKLIQSMELRERFCFPLINQDENQHFLEVYAGHYPGAKLGEDDITILFQSVDILGKFDKTIHKKQSSIRRRLNESDSLFDHVWGLISEN